MAGPDEIVSPTLHDRLVAAATSEGFAGAAGVDIDAAMRSPAQGMQQHVARYDEWLADGRQGSMEYLVRGRDRRVDPRKVFPAARSVFCVILPYSAAPAGDLDGGPRYARYLRNVDYHRDVSERLERALKAVSNSEPVAWKVCVDTSAVLERAWAEQAGLGWIGKNTMLIHPKLGSYFFIGVALIDRELGLAPRPIHDLCGHCRRCLDACPTKAFTAPHALDSRRCTSYLTLERRGEWELPASDRGATGPWVAGCDVCQEVCPFNTKATRDAAASNDPVTDMVDWEALLRETEAEYRERVRDSALKRIKYPEFRRNLSQALVNAQPLMSPQRRESLQEWIGVTGSPVASPSE